jgi:hypothetical protein
MSRAWLVAVLALAGCPASNGESDGGVGDLAVTMADDLAVGGGGTPVDLAPAPNTGTITVTSAASSTQNSFTAGASFVMGVIATSSACTTSYIGGCQASACTVQSADAGSPPVTSSLVSGGTVTISGGATPVSMTPTSGFYSDSSSSQALFTGGEALTFANSGAVAPASSTTLVAPAPSTITTPVAASAYTITRSDGFALAWTGGGPGDVVITIQSSISSTQPGTQFGSVRCLFPVGDGHATVPAAALAVLPAGNASFQLAIAHTMSTTVNDWLMNVTALTYVHAANGDPFIGGQATVN